MDTPTPAPAKYVVPNPRIPKVLGILNIVFASALLIVGLCTSGFSVVTPMFMSMAKEAQKKNKDAAEATRKQQLKELEEEEKAAETEADKEEIRARRKVIEAETFDPMTAMTDPMRMGLNNVKLRVWTWIELGACLVLNVLMLVAGIGLVQLRSWGRSLGLWTAGIKVLNLVAGYLYALIVLVPLISEGAGRVIGEMTLKQFKATNQPIPPGFTVELYIRIYYITYSVMSVGMIVFGSIYPLISLWLLSRPSVRAACSGATPATEHDAS